MKLYAIYKVKKVGIWIEFIYKKTTIHSNKGG